MSRLRNVTGVDTMHTSHKKSVQPRMNRVINAGKSDTFPKRAEVGKVLLTCWVKQTIRETNIPVMRKVLKVLASLEINRINDNQNPGEKDEWCEFLKVGNSTLFCQLDTGAYASVINTTQLRQIAPNAPIKKTKKTLVSYNQHQIKPKGYVTLPVRFKDKKLNVNFYVIDSKQKPILSGKVCQALELVQRVHKIDVNLKELLNQHPGLQKASGVMPGTYSIKIDPTATPVVHGPRRQPTALIPSS